MHTEQIAPSYTVMHQFYWRTEESNANSIGDQNMTKILEI
jgi:hypothetical protein